MLEPLLNRAITYFWSRLLVSPMRNSMAARERSSQNEDETCMQVAAMGSRRRRRCKHFPESPGRGIWGLGIEDRAAGRGGKGKGMLANHEGAETKRNGVQRCIEHVYIHIYVGCTYACARTSSRCHVGPLPAAHADSAVFILHDYLLIRSTRMYIFRDRQRWMDSGCCDGEPSN